ncbi:aspartate aminotransferase family protein [Halobacillus sp. Marseille-Q1614]|uniref:aspartate aminotransferase family protein n=1 Tax=Halobacillus sp. Marseille-Q1614 TaxID=2709134 RepID=UPI0035305428
MSINPPLDQAGSREAPNAISESSGMPEEIAANTVILPFNDLPAAEKLLREHADELSAIVLEPVQGGFIPADQDFMEGLRTISEELGILLIFDEVKSGFRLGLGGAQEIYGVKPDITALGKVLGGGFPIGAVGGKKEIMMVSAPDQGRDILTAGKTDASKQDVLFHSGTYNGHPTILTAGLATIRLLEQEETMEDLITITRKLREDLEQLYESFNIPMQTLGMGSIFNIVLSDDPIKNYRDMDQADTDLRKKIDYELLNQGVYIKPLNRYSLSIVHTEEDINQTVAAHREALKKVLNHSLRS